MRGSVIFIGITTVCLQAFAEVRFHPLLVGSSVDLLETPFRCPR